MTYFFATAEVASGTLGAETPVIYFKNPSSSGLEVSGPIGIAADIITKGSNALFRLYVNPTVSNNGTALPLTVQDQADTSTSLMNVYSSPTVSSKGTLIKHFSVGSNSNSFDLDTEQLVIDPGYSFLITVVGPTLGSTVAIDLSWLED